MTAMNPPASASFDQPDAHGQPRMTRQPCQQHSRHHPASHLNEQHHIWPLGMGGPDSPDNRVVICPTGHNNVHALLKLFQLHRGEPPYAELRVFAFGERELARLGWQRYQAGTRAGTGAGGRAGSR